MVRPFSFLSVIAICAMAGACTTTNNAESLAQNDPYEPTNRAIFDMNLSLDKYFAKPIAEVYNTVVPEPARDGVHNMLTNMDLPVTFANDVLQGEPLRATQTLGRMTINSTLGIGGLFDMATHMGIPDHTEDFGQTLGVYGAGEGPFLVVPLIGPAPPRDLGGKVVDIFFDPFTYARFDGYKTLGYTRAAMDLVDVRARNIDTLEQIERTSVDFYATQRSLYRQYRNSEIRNGKPDTSDLPEL